jgi:hypothetical protein
MENQPIETEEKENLNLIIPKLIGKSVIFSKGMKQRMKSNMIFNEFDHKASKDFYYYLNESNKRYKGLKNGGQLDNYLKEAQIHNRIKAKKILSDNFYTSLNLDKDREAMKINHNGPLLTEMSEIIKKIKEESDNSIDTNSIKEEINKKLYKKKLRESILLQQSQSLINEIPVYNPEKGNQATELSKKKYLFFY